MKKFEQLQHYLRGLGWLGSSFGFDMCSLGLKIGFCRLLYRLNMIQAHPKNQVATSHGSQYRFFEEVGIGVCSLWAPKWKKCKCDILHRSLVTDEYLQVKGSGGKLFAMGDAATMDQPRAREYAAQLFEEFDKDRSGTLDFTEMRQLLKAASARFSHLEEHSRFLDGCCHLAKALAKRLCMLNQIDIHPVFQNNLFYWKIWIPYA